MRSDAGWIEASLLAAVLVAAPALAGAAEIGPSARVRVDFIRETGRVPKLLHVETRVGTLTAIDTTGLTLAATAGRPPLRLSIGEVERIAVSRGRSPRLGMTRGLAWGAAAGFALAVAADAFTTGGAEPRDGLGVGAYLGFLAGGSALGAAIGQGVQAERWEPWDHRRLWTPDTALPDSP
jgi:hypothetical protein